MAFYTAFNEIWKKFLKMRRLITGRANLNSGYGESCAYKLCDECNMSRPLFDHYLEQLISPFIGR